MVQHRLDDVRQHAEVTHLRGGGPAQVVQPPIPHPRGLVECGLRPGEALKSADAAPELAKDEARALKKAQKDARKAEKAARKAEPKPEKAPKSAKAEKATKPKKAKAAPVPETEPVG